MPRFIPDVCTATIPLDEQTGVECRGPVSFQTESGPRCSECFTLYGGTLVFVEPSAIQTANPEPNRLTLGSAMDLAISNFLGGAL